jgi:ABC-type antimicrobial peptide transport system permease subunit
LSVMSRSLRNLTRNKSRTAIVVFIVGFALAVFLTSSMVSSSVSTNVSSLSENLETAITVRPAGSSDMDMMRSEQELMDESIIEHIWTVGSIDAVNPIITKMEFEESSTMFRMGTRIQAMDPSQGVFLTSGGTLTISSGRTLTASDVDSNVAIIGEEFASTKSLAVDSVFSLNGTSFTVVGTYTTGTVFGEQSVILPYNAAKIAYNTSGMSVVYVTASSIGSVDTVVEDLQALLGTDAYDISSVAAMTEAMSSSIQTSIDAIASSSEFGAMISVATAGAVMTFVMVLVTRERTKEIGVLKALGFSNSRISAQLLTESVAFSMLGLAVGVAIALFFAPSIAGIFMDTSSSNSSTSDRPSAPGGGGDPGFSPTGTSGGLGDLTLTPTLLMYGLVLGVGLGALGSLYPIISALRLTPAEALRYDF